MCLCDAASSVGYTRRHLHQRVDEDKNASSSIGKHFRVKHSYVPKDLEKNFTILKKSKTVSFVKCFLLMNWDQISMYSQTRLVRKSEIIVNYVTVTCFLLFCNNLFLTFSWFTGFNFFVLYLFLCKFFIFTFKLYNDRNFGRNVASFYC